MLTKEQALNRLEMDIKLRGRAESTAKIYRVYVSCFLDFCSDTKIEDINVMHVRNYLEHLVTVKSYAPRTVNTNSSAIRFFMAVTLGTTMNYLQIPLVKVPKKLPAILVRDEVSMLINTAMCDIKFFTILLLGYGSGLRISEVIRLKASDIDSTSMRILVRNAKGYKDRFTLLPKATLVSLRNYWRTFRPCPKGYLFPSIGKSGHISQSKVSVEFKKILGKTDIKKNVTYHTLRHCFATHLLEDGVNLFQIKSLLGHSSISTTSLYLRLANNTTEVISPADKLSFDTKEEQS